MIQKKINELTNNLYEGFIIKQVEYNIAKNLLEIILVFPESYYKKLKKEDKIVIIQTVTEIVNIKDLKVRVKFEYSFADNYLIKNTICKFIAKEEPLYANNISVDDINVVAKEDIIKLSFVLDSGTYSYFTTNNFEGKLKKYLSYRFTQEVYTKLILDTSKDAKIQNIEPVTDNIFSSRETRTMVISNQTKLMGRAFVGVPSYIVDIVDNPKEQVVACGKVSNIFTKFLENSGKTLLKFNMNDKTGTINVVKFDKSKNEEYKKLEEGMEVVVQGKASINDFDNKMQMIVNNISTCEIDYSSINLEPVYNKANLYYLNVFPKKFVDIEQTSLFDANVVNVPEYLKNKTFIAFDLETTGLNGVEDRIVEIGACKMVNGEITEIFETLVNPMMHIPAKASEVNNIFDDDVKDAPHIEDVFPDFYKFIENFPLIGHNVGFDIEFINRVAKDLNYKVDNELIDTLELAKTYLKLKNNKLETVCNYYDVVNLNAHRACFDAVATMKIFQRLSENLKSEENAVDIL